MTEPTDDELDAVLCNQWPAFSMQATLVRVWVRAAMRDALAKWGTPAPVGVEPVSCDCRNPYSHDECTLKAGCKINSKLSRKAPQPVAREPLSDEQIEALPMWKRFVGLWPETRREIVRIIEAQHGIKGGQHVVKVD